MISYFDAHCDTIYRCEMTGDNIALDYGTVEEQRAYFARCSCLRKNTGHIDLERGSKFARYAQVFALFYDADDPAPNGLWAVCNRLHDRFLRELEQNGDRVRQCRSGCDIEAAVASGRAAALLSVEGADLLECDVRRIETVAAWGVRFLNPVWNRANILSGTNLEDSGRGLSPKGKDFIREMENHGIYADASHLSDAGFWDLTAMAKKPVIASHSNSRAICNHRRNLTDDMFCAIRDTGGVAGLNLYRDFVGDDSMDTLLAHIEHFLNLGGEKTVCIGGDLDGCEALAAGMRGVEDVPRIYDALKSRGYSDDLLEDIFWNNLRRLF